jgi:hypothetical protein
MLLLGASEADWSRIDLPVDGLTVPNGLAGLGLGWEKIEVALVVVASLGVPLAICSKIDLVAEAGAFCVEAGTAAFCSLLGGFSSASPRSSALRFGFGVDVADT